MLCLVLRMQLQNANGFRKMGWKAILNKSQDKWRWGFNRQGVKNAGIPIFYCPELRCGGSKVESGPFMFAGSL